MSELFFKNKNVPAPKAKSVRAGLPARSSFKTWPSCAMVRTRGTPSHRQVGARGFACCPEDGRCTGAAHRLPPVQAAARFASPSVTRPYPTPPSLMPLPPCCPLLCCHCSIVQGWLVGDLGCRRRWPMAIYRRIMRERSRRAPCGWTEAYLSRAGRLKKSQVSTLSLFFLKRNTLSLLFVLKLSVRQR